MPLYGQFEPQETLAGCFSVFDHVSRRYGLPEALYLDRARQFTTTRHGGTHVFQRDDKPTHFEIAMQTLAVQQHLNSEGGLVYLNAGEETAELGYAIYLPGVSGVDQIYDGLMATAFNCVRELCGPGWRPSEVLFAHARPDDLSPYRDLFRVTPRFNAEVSALRFPARWLTKSIDGADEARRRLAQQRADAVGGGQVVEQVRRTLRILLLRGKHTGDEVAQMLSMHRRTLNRRIKAEGSTFQQLLDEVRFTVARQLLAGTDISLDDVAAMLGYSGVSPFMRAFRRWTGSTPGGWRRAVGLDVRSSTGSDRQGVQATGSGKGSARRRK